MNKSMHTVVSCAPLTFLQRFLADTECLATSALLSCMFSFALLMDWLRNKDSCSCGMNKHSWQQNIQVVTESNGQAILPRNL